MVAAGVGLAIIPELVAHRMMTATSIVPISLTDAWATRHLSLCIRSLDELTSSARALINHLSAGLPLDSEKLPKRLNLYRIALENLRSRILLSITRHQRTCRLEADGHAGQSNHQDGWRLRQF